MSAQDGKPESLPGERLQKILAGAGVASRRRAEELIAAGRVSVNGQVVREMGVRADPSTDRVELDGKTIVGPGAGATPAQMVYVAMNKPVGVVTTASDPEGRPTVLDVLKAESARARALPRLFPVGRLDADTTGLLLLTNDGELTFRLTHPRYGVDKEYRALVRGRPDEEDLERLRRGVEIEGEKTSPARVEETGRRGGDTWLRVVIHEGRKRQVRLMLATAGHHVIELQRVRIGPLSLGNLEPGRWRLLEAHEVKALRQAVALEPGRHAPRQPKAKETGRR